MTPIYERRVVITIHKYPLEMADEFTIDMPKDARILSVQMQRGVPMIWALVDTTEKEVSHRFALRGTGHDCSGLYYAFVGTFQTGNGLVFHLFDLGDER
jgi:hypothetical protein